VGSKIPAEPVLVGSLGVGRNTVREAVRALVHSGMLEPRQGDGTYVRATTTWVPRCCAGCAGPATWRRSRSAPAWSATAARLAALRRTPADVAALRAVMARREAARLEHDDEKLITADIEFHRIAVATAHNGMLTDLYCHLTTACALCSRRSAQSADRRRALPAPLAHRAGRRHRGRRPRCRAGVRRGLPSARR